MGRNLYLDSDDTTFGNFTSYKSRVIAPLCSIAAVRLKKVFVYSIKYYKLLDHFAFRDVRICPTLRIRSVLPKSGHPISISAAIYKALNQVASF